MAPLEELDAQFMNHRLVDLSAKVDQLLSRVATIEGMVKEMGPISEKVSGILQTNASMNEALRGLRDTVKELNDRQVEFDSATDRLREELARASQVQEHIRDQQQKNIRTMTSFNSGMERSRCAIAAQAERLTNHHDRITDLGNKVTEINDGVSAFLSNFKMMKRLIYGVGSFIIFVGTVQGFGLIEWIMRLFAK